MSNKKGERVVLINNDSLLKLKEIETESVDVIATDPPYFLSSGGISCKNGKMVTVDKGDWDNPELISPIEFYTEILVQLDRILKPNGTIWLFGTMHNIFMIGSLIQEKGYKILNNITWEKSNPSPNLSCRMFTHSTETIIWAKKNEKAKHYFNYHLMKEFNNNKQMKDVWRTSTTKKSEKIFGNHPTQKPLEIMERIILASSKEGDTILDCFMGSGTTIIAALMHNRNAIGIELDKEFFEISKKRVYAFLESEQLKLNLECKNE